MSADLIDTLPLPQRLALSYAPRSSREATLALLALDNRLAGILRGASEPLIAQMKLAWWRDRLSEDRADWPQGEPLLALLRDWPGDVARLVSLVDGWETLLAEEVGDSEIAEFAEGRAAGWAVLGGTEEAAARLAAREWALHDLLLHSADPSADLRQMVTAQEWKPARLSRQLRPLAVLHALAHRAVSKDRTALLDGPAAMFFAMRVGMLGR